MVACSPQNTAVTITSMYDWMDSTIAIHNTGWNRAPLLLKMAHPTMLISKLIQSVFSAILNKNGMTEACLLQIIVGLGES